MIKPIVLRCVLSVLLAWMAFSGLQAQKTIIFGAKDPAGLPPFRESFLTLAKNRAVYNDYNDSIFIIKDHDRWVSFFRRRALKNQQIFTSNKVLLSNIFDYFKRDSTYAEAYIELFKNYFHEYRARMAADPFMTLQVCKILERYNAASPDSLNLSNLVNLWLGEVYFQIGNLGADSLMYEKSFHYYRTLLREEAKRYDSYEWAHAMALRLLVSNITYLRNKYLSMDEHREYLRQLKEWYQVHKNDATYSEGIRKNISNVIRTDAESLLRNIYMVDSTIMDRTTADSLMRAIIRRNLANDKLTDLSFSRTLTMQVKLGQITANQAVEQFLARYKRQWKKLRKKRLDAYGLNQYLQPFFSVFYLNDISDASYSRKRKFVKKMCRDIEIAYQHREDQQTNTNYVASLNKLTVYPRITKYLTPRERIHFLNALNVATQVTTYAHSAHVAMIAESLMEGVVKYQPKLLVGTLGCRNVEEVVKNRKKFVAFAHDAAMYHDLGKNSIISVVTNDYRPLTDEEFAIVKRHPELGLQYLELAPELEKFHDTTLGHHKWYNGKGGYPESFDNTKSPMRIMIDLVTLSDCMQAATERVGRNYKGEKTFDTVMAEFRRDAGVRYNPELVAFIDAHADVEKKLADLVNDGWAEIYYGIYSRFIQ